MATSLAAQAQQAGATYSAPGVAVNENIATPATSRYISQRSSLQNFTAPMTPRYYTGGTGGFRSYSRGQQATLRGAGQTASMIGTSLAKSASSAVFPGASVALSQSLGLATSAASPGIVAAYGFKDPFFAASTKTALGSALGKAIPYVAAAVSFFTTQGSFGRKAGNAAASFAAASLMAVPDPTGVTKAIAVAIMGVQMLVGSLGGKGNRNIGIQPIGLPENAPAILQQQGIGKGPTTLRHYRDFTGHWKDTARPIDAAGALTQQRLKSLSRIFPGMMDVSDALAKQRDVMYGPSSSQQAAFGNIQTYVDALYRAEGFVENLFADKIVQGYIGRKTNMTFEEFEKGFDFASQKVVTTNVKLPRAQKYLADAWEKATRGRGGPIYLSTGVSPYEVKTREYLGNVYRPVTTGGGQGRYKKTQGKAIIIGYQIRTRRGRPKRGGGQPAQWSDKLTSVGDYDKMLKEAQAKAREYFVGPQEKQIQEYQDYLVSTPQFGSYTYFRPFQPNWTPGTPQLGLPGDAPGPDIDTLKPVLNIQDDPFTYGGMGGGSGYPQTRFGGIMIPRASQGKMARQA